MKLFCFALLVGILYTHHPIPQDKPPAKKETASKQNDQRTDAGYQQFAALFSKQFFGSMRSAETNELLNPEDQLSDAEKEILKNSPTAKSWKFFQKALHELAENGDRKAAANALEDIVARYPSTYYVQQSRDLLKHLKNMIQEDDQYQIPKEFDKLTIKEKISVHLHFLRDTRAIQISQPGSCRVVFYGNTTPGGENYNAAAALYEIGDAALKPLAELFEDKRPIRGVGYWRNFVPKRRVLRYGDAAQQIADRIMAKQ